MAYDNSNSFVLWINEKRGDNPKAPTMKGPGEITCEKCGHVNLLDAAVWSRMTKAGAKMLSGKFQPRRPKEGKPAPSPDEPNDDLPW